MTTEHRIIRLLTDAAKEHSVHILYACEAGSRAWGFASPESDYDVRFIYAHTREWYLSFDVESRQDVIDLPTVGGIDCSGWDIRKALYLFTRSNGALLEWLHSPIRYIEHGNFAEEMRKLSLAYCNGTALLYHYSHIARKHAPQRSLQDRAGLKKYFHVLRPLLAMRFIERHAAVPPVALITLADAVAPEPVVPEIAKLVEIARNSSKIQEHITVPAIDTFIAQELDRHGDSFSGQGRPDQIGLQELKRLLNGLFRSSIGD